MISFILLSSLKENLFPDTAILITRIIGWLAGLMSVIAFMPQAIKTMKTKETRGLSLGMYSLYISANLCLILWALFDLISSLYVGYQGANTLQTILGDITVIVPNIIATITTSIIVFIKIRNIANYKDYAGRAWQWWSKHLHFKKHKKILKS